MEEDWAVGSEEVTEADLEEVMVAGLEVDY